MSTPGLLLVALFIAIGLACVVVPILPGGLVVFAAIAVWALLVQTTVGWAVLAVAGMLFVAAEVIKFIWPMQRMKRADVATRSLVVGAILGVIGFFVIPVLGMAVGFVLGVFLSEYAALHNGVRAWTSTKHAIKGVALAMGVELTAAVLAAVTWAVAVLV